MKTLYLLRHAKSSRDDSALEDHDRPLSRRGKLDCPLIAKTISELEIPIEHIYCSPARRTRSTLRRIRQDITLPLPEHQLDDNLYTFDHEPLLDWLKERKQSEDNILLVGHNPAFEDLAELLTGRDLGHVPTCGFLELNLRVEYWDQLRAGCGELKHFLRPRQLRSPS